MMKILVPNLSSILGNLRLSLVLVSCLTSQVQAAPFFSQEPPDGGATSINSAIVASQFSVPNTLTLETATVFLNDKSTTFSTFGGTIGWAIYSGAEPGTIGTVIASGQDSSPLIVDSGYDLAGGTWRDIFAVTFDFDSITSGSVANLGAGLY